ncbi:MAG: hypothetical protein IK045_04755 [Bacteroidales bacterium]|nr:hypothetical protein [Bacteroidales bacterium]
MENTKNITPTKNYTLTLTKEIGKLWMLKNVKPFHKDFELFFEQDLGRDFGKLMTCGCTNYVLDLLAGEAKKMELDFRIAPKRIEMPGYVEFELVATYNLSAKYHVNNCPGEPQLQAWAGTSTRQIFKEYPVFAYIRKK